MGKNIVLDIDATLVNTHGDDGEFLNLKFITEPKMLKYRKRIYSMNLSDVTTEPGDGEELKLYGVYRPYLKEFLDFCFDYFDNVIIWSAGKKKYVEKMCELMFVDAKKQPLVIYNWNNTTIDGDRITKPLKKLYNDPRTKGEMNEKNTFVVDDRDDTYYLNKNNGILIPEYEAALSYGGLKMQDDNLLKLMAWFSLDEVSESEDVRELEKDKIFTTSVKDYEKMVN
tara:strand:- start:1103 stop:1780 length:678 start_codon:yes stop_codon:yes gene_type:complete